jgi:hypothetical protein
MANEEDKLVWVKLAIDGKNVGQAFKVEITSETNNVDQLKRAIVNQTPELSSLAIGPASLLVYPPGTNVSALEGAEPLRPGLPLSDLDFREITGEKPLIVTAKSRPQQQQDTTNVSLYTYRAVVVHQQEKFALRIQCFDATF